MLTARRPHDPFAPFVPVKEPPVEETPVVVRELGDLFKSELVELAVQYGVPSYGSKGDLIDRLRSVPTARF